MAVPKHLMDFYTKICQAKSPEEVFGELNGGNPLDSLKKVYHTHSFACHPDHYAMDEEAYVYAGETFKALTELFNEALKKVDSGTYGKADAPSLSTSLFDMKTRKGL